jgi:hypothetical protein
VSGGGRHLGNGPIADFMQRGRHRTLMMWFLTALIAIRSPAPLARGKPTAVPSCLATVGPPRHLGRPCRLAAIRRAGRRAGIRQLCRLGTPAAREAVDCAPVLKSAGTARSVKGTK